MMTLYILYTQMTKKIIIALIILIVAVISYPKLVNIYEIKQAQIKYWWSYDTIKLCVSGGWERGMRAQAWAWVCWLWRWAWITVPTSGCGCDSGQCWDGETCVNKGLWQKQKESMNKRESQHPYFEKLHQPYLQQ